MQSSDPLIVDVLVPARNQASRLPGILAALPHTLVRSVVVIDNGSTDTTASVARDAGAVVLRESRVGYGAACMCGIRHLQALPVSPDVVVFMAGDGTDDPDDIARLIEPLGRDNAELIIGVRERTVRRKARSRVVLGMIGAIYRHKYQDVGSLRAIRFPALVALSLTDPTEAFLVEMQVKAIRFGLRVKEISVHSFHLEKPSVRTLSRSVKTTGRAVFHILRHSTIR